MVILFALFAWFALVLAGIGIIVALEPIWNRSAARPAPACRRRQQAPLIPADASAAAATG